MENFNTLIHFHIGRTGGVSLRENVLKRKFKSNFKLVTVNKIHKFKTKYSLLLSDLIKLDDIQKDNIKCIAGHMPFGIHNIFPQRCVYISLVRSPIERAISEYYAIKMVPDHPFHKYVIPIHKLSFEDFVRLDVRQINLPKDIHMVGGGQNIQTQYFNGTLARSALGDFAPPYENSLDRAIDNIRKYFSLIGTVENYDKFLLLLMKKMGWKFSDIFHTFSKFGFTEIKPKREKISNKVIDLIEKYNTDDFILYDFVNKKFNEEIKQFTNFKEDLEKFKKMNSFYGNLYMKLFFRFFAKS